MEKSIDNARAVALSVLNKCMSAGQYSNISLDTAIKRASLTEQDKALLTVLVYGVLERKLTLDACIESLSSRSVEELDLTVCNLLRMGLYQIKYTDRIPDHAAVNETVSLASKKTRGFVNAILRAFLRTEKRLPISDPNDDPVGYLSIRYSFLPALCQVFLDEFGFARAESLLGAFCERAPLTLRVNTLRVTPQALCERLTADGYAASPTPSSPVGLLLPNAPVTALSGFVDGDFFVQDEASQLCVEALDAREGMTVIDVCACPGSKSFGAAIGMQNTGRVISCDLHANKLSLVESGAARLGISIIETVARDAQQSNEEWLGLADRVLCDVPCSGFGVFSKKPELRYKDPVSSERLPEIQQEILCASCAYVKRGGRLVYSTCTVLPRENEQNVHRFLASHPDFSLVQMRTLYPDTDHTDGFFYAVMERS